MAVQPQTPYIEHVANGVTRSFNLDFDCDNKDHLIVLVDDHEPILGDWQLDSGALTFKSAPKNGAIIKVQRNTPFKRDRDYQSYDNSFRPPAVNKDFDWIWWKLQELGVSDWILGNRINALKNYVDRKDDELKAYLLEEIRKQGVALDQLDDYYNYLMERLAQIAVDKGWDASFVVDGDKNQHEINEIYRKRTNGIFYAVDFGLKVLNTAEQNSIALLNLSEAVNAASGGHIIFPKGEFLIGHQTLAGAENKSGSWLYPEYLSVKDCKNPVLLEFNQTILKFKDGMRHGAFDPITGNPVVNGGVNNKYQAGYGRAIDLRNNEDIRLIGQLRINGNDKNLILGGLYGDLGRQCVSYGIYAIGNKILSSDGAFVLHNIPLDGLYVSSLNSNDSKTDMNGVVSIKNARQAFSLTGGWNQTYTNCYFGKTGMGETPFTPPAANIDLEAEITGDIKNINFYSCIMSDAKGGSIVSEFTATRGAYFHNCLIENSQNVSIYCKSHFEFNNCHVNGTIEPFYSRDQFNPAVMRGCTIGQYMQDGSNAYLTGALFSDGGSAAVYSSISDLTINFDFNATNSSSAFYLAANGVTRNITFNVRGNPTLVAAAFGVVTGMASIDGIIINDKSSYGAETPNIRKSIEGDRLDHVKNAFISKNADGLDGILWGNPYYSAGGRAGWWSGSNMDRQSSLLEPKELSILKNRYGSSDYYGGGQIISSASAVPSGGWWRKGTIIFNYNPSVGQPIGWVCTKEGIAGATEDPAVFAKFGIVEVI